jgi:16S rRNA (cytidine1402-2'-O)-methyltransferase
VIAGRDRRELIASRQEAVRSELTLEEHMRRYQESGMDREEAMKAVAKDRGITKREVYAQLLEGDSSEDRA